MLTILGEAEWFINEWEKGETDSLVVSVGGGDSFTGILSVLGKILIRDLFLEE